MSSQCFMEFVLHQLIRIKNAVWLLNSRDSHWQKRHMQTPSSPPTKWGNYLGVYRTEPYQTTLNQTGPPDGNAALVSYSPKRRFHEGLNDSSGRSLVSLCAETKHLDPEAEEDLNFKLSLRKKKHEFSSMHGSPCLPKLKPTPRIANKSQQANIKPLKRNKNQDLHLYNETLETQQTF